MTSVQPRRLAPAPRSELGRWLLALVLASGLSPALALAEEPATCGVEPFEAGVAAFDAGDLARGAACFREALEQLGNPAVRYNIAACLDAMGELPEARNQLMLYARDTAAELVSGERRALVEGRIAAIDEQVAVLEIRVEGEEAELSVDGAVVEGGVAAGVAWAVAPGEHEVAARRAGSRPVSRRVSCGAGERCQVALSLEPAPGAEEVTASPAATEEVVDGHDRGPTPREDPVALPPPAPPEEALAGAARPAARPPLGVAWFGTTVGLAAALAIAGSVTAGLVYVRGDEAVAAGRACEAGDGPSCDEARAAAEGGEALGQAATGLFATAGLAAAAALVLALLTDWLGHGDRVRLDAGATSGGRGLGLSAAVAF